MQKLTHIFSGSRAAHTDDSIAPAAWQHLLTTKFLGRGECRYAESFPSTNVILREMGHAGAPHGSLCLCECQSAGRGRLGRAWTSPAGQGLLLSVLLRPNLRPEQAPLITFCAALAMARAVENTSGIAVKIKWPNDLVSHGRKLCGILLEVCATDAGISHVVVGTGLNVRKGAYPPELAHQAASLEDFAPAPLRRDILICYLKHLEDVIRVLEREGFAGIEADYRTRSCTLGSQVNVTGGATLTGVAEAIDESGALLIRTGDGTLHRVLAGDVSVRGVMGYV